MFTLHREANALIYEFNGEFLRIEAWGKNSLRVRSVFQGTLLDTDYALLPQNEIIPEITIKEYQGILTNGNITAIADINPWNLKCTLSFYNQNGTLLLRESGDGGALNKDSRKFSGKIGGDFELLVSFASNPSEKLFGMGQYQMEFLDVKNCTLELAHRNSQASVPFVLSNLGYGFFWHNPSIGRVTFGKNVTEWYASNTKQMDYWITAGNNPDEIEHSYSAVTGRVPMMPEYGLGFWQCKLRYWNQEQLLEVAREYKRKNIPIDVIVCDFFHWPHMGDFRFEEEFFPDPKGMVEELKQMGIELMVSIWPQIDVQSENFLEMKQKGLLVKTERGVEICMRFGGESVFFDATNSKARSYVWDKCNKNYYENGIRLFWLDEAEPEYNVYDFDNYRYHLGACSQIGNLYPQYYSRTFYEGLKQQGQNKIVNLVRCAWAGSQRYGALVWSGDIHSDWETFRRQVCAGLNMGLAGIPWWTTDIGGFSGGDPSNKEFRELLVRWFQWGTFCPVMRLHGDRASNNRKVFRKDGSEALFTGGDNEIWSFGAENETILKNYILIREILRSYIRTLMQEAHDYGRPIMRTMFYEFPEQEICWTLTDQYMFGADILVAPIMYPNMSKREVYLPEGSKWTTIHDQKEYQGGTIVSIDTLLNVIPIFIKDSAKKFLSEISKLFS